MLSFFTLKEITGVNMSKNNLKKLVMMTYVLYFSGFLWLCSFEIMKGNTDLINTLLTFPLYFIYGLLSVAAMLLIDYVSDQGTFYN